MGFLCGSPRNRLAHFSGNWLLIGVMNSRLEGPITSLGKFKPLLFMRLSERFLWVVGKRLVSGQLQCVFLSLHSRNTRGNAAIDSTIPLGCRALQTAELSPRRACPSDWRRPARTFTEQISADLLLWLWSLTQATSAASGKVSPQLCCALPPWQLWCDPVQLLYKQQWIYRWSTWKYIHL